jgi:membrane-bound serine protease (ClpP class)
MHSVTKPRPRVLRLLLWVVLAIAGALPALRGAFAAGDHVDFLTVEGPITPVVAGYIERGIENAADEGAELVVIRLDTPGGSVEITQKLCQKMVAARVPVCVWVTPSQGAATSAGTFVVLAGHMAAMTPGTSIGAASPVGQQGEDLPETMRSKVDNVMVALIKGLAERRGEDALIWAEDAVRQASTLTEREALEIGVIDFIAQDEGDLLAQIEGRTVDVDGVPMMLHPMGAELREVPMSGTEGFLHSLTNPSVAYILLMIGLNGIIFELSNPGFGVAGIVGAICLLLGLFAMGTLEANFVGLVLIGLSFVMFVVDVKAGTGGVLTVGGIACLIFGSIVLFDSPDLEIPWMLIVTNGIVTGAFVVFAVNLAVRAQQRQPTTGREGLIGAVGVTRTALEPKGQISLFGEIWNARAEGGAIAPGETVEVVKVNGLTVDVRRTAPGKQAG